MPPESPRRAAVAALPLALGLGLGALPAAAMPPAESPRTPIAPAPRVPLGQLSESSVVADGPVLDAVQSGDVVYVHGSFTEIGRYSGPGRILDAASGADRPAPVFGEGQVSVTLADGSGGWYVAGDVRGGVVHVRADGSVDPAFAVEVDGLVSALARDGDTLYLGGLFTRVNGVERTNLAAVSVASGTLLPFTAEVAQRVAELAVDADTVWVGAGTTLAALDKATGVARTASAFPAGVRALALGDGVVHVGTDGLRTLDADTAEPVGGFADPVVDGTVHALLLAGDRLYVGTDGTDGSSQLIAVDPATGAADGSFDARVGGGVASFGQPGGAFDLAVVGDRLWVGGAFTSAGGAPAGNLAVLDAATGDALAVGVPRLHEQVNAVDVSGDAVYVGGHSYLRDPHRAAGLAALDADTLEPVRGFRGRAEVVGGELTVAPNAVYLSPRHFRGYSPYLPYFSDTSATIRAYDPDSGAPDATRTHRVEDLTGVTTLGNRLVVAQRLEDDRKFPRNRITVYAPDGTRGWSFRMPLRGYVTELDTVGGDLLVAGSFKRRSPAGGPRNTALLRLDARTGARRAYFDPRIHGPVNDVSVRGGSIYASGLFATVHQGLDQDRPGLVKLSARSVKSERFVPDVAGGGNPDQRATAIGPDLVWADSYPPRFLDAITGEQVQLADWLDSSWLQAVTGDAETAVVAGRDWASVAGYGIRELGWVTAFGSSA